MSALPLSVFDGALALRRRGASESRSPFLIETTGDFEAAEEAWSVLEPAASAFQSRAWAQTWRDTLGAAVGAKPCFLTVRERGTRRPVALFPLCVRRRFGVGVVEFPDLGVTDYNAPLCAPDLELSDAQLDAFWQEARLAVPGADVFHFQKAPVALYGRPAPFSRLSWLKPVELCCWTIALPASREVYDRTALRAKDRKEQRRKRRNLAERLGEPVLVEATTRAEAAEIFEALKAMRAERFRRQGRRDLLQEPKFARFYETLATEAAPGFVSLSCVMAGEKRIAALMALRHADAYVLIMHSFAADLESLSPGVVAIDELISHLIGGGVRFCDFTTGNETYKKQFGVSECGMREGLDAVTPQGRLYAAAYQGAAATHAAARAAALRALGKYAPRARRLLRG